MGKSIYLSWRQMEIVCNELEEAVRTNKSSYPHYSKEIQEIINKLLPYKYVHSEGGKSND